MTESEFQALAKQGYTRVPVVLEARADLYTPLAVYVLLAGGPYSYLLESVVGGERFGRYSFIGLACAERIEARGRTVRRLLRDARGADAGSLYVTTLFRWRLFRMDTNRRGHYW